MDLVICILSLPLVTPVIMILATIIAMTGSTPFFSQTRIGQYGRPFRIWKLRTMVHDSDQVIEKYFQGNLDAQEEWRTTQKLKYDPRITAFGLFLRKTSLDELPQIWNVLRADMSLVGPRPMMDNQKHIYPGTDYYNLRPGISGNWQVSMRNESTFVDRAAYDRRYNLTLSLREDTRILKDTVHVVLRATGY
ncbi:sugar transferase [Sulfitobacter sp.]|uniref:sugar transferase n=1 Tax=Sulfitobacter sp. TaxID=1903071 RepID=UPI004058D714